MSGIGNISPISIAMSGLQVESARMNVIASNIANASTAKCADGQPYRRQFLLTETPRGQLGVQIDKIAHDQSAFKQIYEPGRPDAVDGYVSAPNVEVPREMVDMVIASRAYQANAAVMKRYAEVMDVALELLR